MKHISSDNYTIAWFKLAECVTRGERERAFGVYRLLSHSLDDRALSLQLEGDLFLAFDMHQEAISCYEKAAHKYKQVGRLLEAASVYEHICLLNPEDLSYKKELLWLCSNVQLDARVAQLACALIKAYILLKRFDAIASIAPCIEQLDSFVAQATCYEKIVHTLIAHSVDQEHICKPYIELTINALLKHGNDTLLQQYMQKLKVTHDGLYHVAVHILEK